MPNVKVIATGGVNVVAADSGVSVVTAGSGVSVVTAGAQGPQGPAGATGPAGADGASGTPGGGSGQLQYNSGGAFAGAAALTYATSGTHLTITTQAATDTGLLVAASAPATDTVRVTHGALTKFKIKSDGDVCIGQMTGNSGTQWLRGGGDHGDYPRVGFGQSTTFTVASDNSGTILRVSASGTSILNGGVFGSDPATDSAFSTKDLTAGSGSVYVLNNNNGTAQHLCLASPSSVSTVRPQATLAGSWATSTDASRKARVTLNVYDTAAREAIRAEASGSAAMLGFFGASAVVRQTLPAAGVVTAADIRTALINLGLCA